MYTLKAKFWEFFYVIQNMIKMFSHKKFLSLKILWKKVTGILKASNKLNYLRFVIQAEEG